MSALRHDLCLRTPKGTLSFWYDRNGVAFEHCSACRLTIPIQRRPPDHRDKGKGKWAMPPRHGGGHQGMRRSSTGPRKGE